MMRREAGSSDEKRGEGASASAGAAASATAGASASISVSARAGTAATAPSASAGFEASSGSASASSSPKASKAPKLPRPFARFLGFAFLQGWLLSACLGGALCAKPISTEALLSPAALPVCVGVALASIVVLFCTLRVVPLSRQRLLCAVCAAVGAAGSAVMVLTSHDVISGTSTLANQACFAACAACAGAGVAVLVLAWQEYYATCGVRAAVPGMALTSALGIACFLAAELLPMPAGAVLVCLLPLAGGLALRPCAGTRFFASSPARMPMRRLFSNMLHDYSPRFFIMCGLIVMAFSVGCCFARADTALTSGPVGVVAVGLCGLGVCVGCLVVVLSSPQTAMRFFYAAIPLVMLDACVMSTRIAGSQTIAILLGAAGVTLTYCLVWALMVAIAQAKRLPSLGLIAFLHSSCFTGAALGVAVVRACGVDASHAPVLMLAILGAAALLFASFNGQVTVAEEMFAAPQATPQERTAAALAERFGLTARETEVLQVWLAGHNAAYMEETLHISRNTVKTHLNHIYQKTGASGREGLLALMEQAPGEKK